ncbi:MAG: hypothetical protein K0R38_255 [Polyangiaceae bacterium]|nr:hypothetical protein [Polyangiaceae bacterium]
MPRSSSKVTLPRATLLVLGLALHTLHTLPAAAAAPPESATALVERGLSLRRARDDSAALASFEQAYRAQQSPMILAQIALAEQALGRFVAAEQHLSESLSSGDAWVEQRRAALETALRAIQSRLSWLEVSTNVRDAQLWLDAQPAPLSSSPFRLTAGTHTLVLRTTEGITSERVVELRGGERHVYQLELPTPPAPRLQAPPSPPPAPPRPVGRPVAAAPSRTMRTWAYVTATVAGVALVEAVAASLLRQGYVDDYNSPSCAPDRSERCAAYRSSASTFGTIAVVGYAVAGVAGVTSIALFAEPWWNRPDGAASNRAVVGISGAF